MIKNHPPPVLRFFPNRRKPARAVGFVAAAEDILAGDHRIGFAQHSHGDLLEVELLERAARFPEAVFHRVFNYFHTAARAGRVVRRCDPSPGRRGCSKRGRFLNRPGSSPPR